MSGVCACVGAAGRGLDRIDEFAKVTGSELISDFGAEKKEPLGKTLDQWPTAKAAAPDRPEPGEKKLWSPIQSRSESGDGEWGKAVNLGQFGSSCFTSGNTPSQGSG